MLTTRSLRAAVNARVARFDESKIFRIGAILAKIHTSSRDHEGHVDKPNPRPILNKVHHALESCRGSGQVRHRLDLNKVQHQFRCELEEAQIASQRAIQEYLVQNGFARESGAICHSIAVSGTSALDVFSLPDRVSKEIRGFWQEVNGAIGRAELNFQNGISSAKNMRALRNQRTRGRPPIQGSKQHIRWLTIAGWLWALLQTETINEYQLGRILDEAGFELDSVFPRTKKATQCRLFFESNEIGDRGAVKLKSFRDIVRLQDSIKKLKCAETLPSGAPGETPWRLITKALQRAEHQARDKRLLGPLSVNAFVLAFPKFASVLRRPKRTNRS